MLKITATGNIGKDAIIKQVTNEHSVTTFSIASTKKIKGENVTTWINCQKWNSDKLAQYLTKGTKVAVHGDLEIRERDGKYYTSINVYELEFMSRPEVSQRETEHDTEHGTEQDDEGDPLPF
jgi:single-strand DNA-binding protein